VELLQQPPADASAVGPPAADAGGAADAATNKLLQQLVSEALENEAVSSAAGGAFGGAPSNIELALCDAEQVAGYLSRLAACGIEVSALPGGGETVQVPLDSFLEVEQEAALADPAGADEAVQIAHKLLMDRFNEALADATGGDDARQRSRKPTSSLPQLLRRGPPPTAAAQAEAVERAKEATLGALAASWQAHMMPMEVLLSRLISQEAQSTDECLTQLPVFKVRRPPRTPAAPCSRPVAPPERAPRDYAAGARGVRGGGRGAAQPDRRVRRVAALTCRSPWRWTAPQRLARRALLCTLDTDHAHRPHVLDDCVVTP
jgi:hypothetical protein